MEKDFYNIVSNEWELKVVYQQNFLFGKKLAALFFCSMRFRRDSLLMYGKWRRVKIWGSYMVGFLTKLKNLLQHNFTSEKRKFENRFLQL